jgi:hypothetical protein
MSKVIRIANGQGFWGDSIDAPVRLIKDGPIDYLTLDYLAEVTLSIMQRQKLNRPDAGYARDFVDLIDKILPDLVSNDIKVISNAGGVNPEACRVALLEIAKAKDINIKIGIIKGDDIFDKLDRYVENGLDFKNLETGEDFIKVKDKVYSANVYIDSFCIARALDKGAQIVLAGRVSDPGLALGPAIHEFGWTANQLDLIAAGTLAGHIIECGAQCTGGNYTRWDEIEDLANIGYPIIEMQKNGEFIITKHNGTGGLVNRQTVSEQILYEMGNPTNYISPDVCVDFTSFNLTELGNNRVGICNVMGFEATPTYKVSISYFAGYKASGQLTISGPNALKKAQLVANLIWTRLENAGCSYEDRSTEFLGISSCHGDINDTPGQVNEVVLRLGVKDNDKEKVNRFGKEIAPVITNGPPGVTGFAGGRPKAQEIVAYWPTLIPKDLITTDVDVN